MTYISPKSMSKISVTYKIYIWDQLDRQVLKNGILRTGICTACMNGNILSSCALLNFFKPIIQLLPWIFPPKQYKITYDDRRISYYKK
jgi:hypothetical protein